MSRTIGVTVQTDQVQYSPILYIAKVVIKVDIACCQLPQAKYMDIARNKLLIKLLTIYWSLESFEVSPCQLYTCAMYYCTLHYAINYT